METAYIGLSKLRLALVERPEGMARVFVERWRAAAAPRARTYWLGRVTWLAVRPLSAAITSVPAAAGSSDTLPDRHPC